MENYGKELILDIHRCDVNTLTRDSIKKFCKALCDLIDMEPCEFHFWDYEGDPDGYAEAPDHLKGVSAIQFITTSNITIHSLDKLRRVYVNIFSCKEFDGPKAKAFTRKWFGGVVVKTMAIGRK